VLFERWLPSGRSLAVGIGLLVACAAAYVIARQTSIFSVQRIEVEGAPPALAAQIRSALQPLTGESLVGFDGSAAARRLAVLPQVAQAHFDRDFPHTLRVLVKVEQPVALLREASSAWLVSSSGRVLARLRAGSYPPLPRIWLDAGADVTVGAPVDSTADLVRVASLLARFRLPEKVLSVQRSSDGGLALELRGGREVRLGDTSNLPAKLAVAAAILPRATAATYVDVSVPTRVVAGYAVGQDTPTSSQG
jgi:cell division protein FtsQ